MDMLPSVGLKTKGAVEFKTGLLTRSHNFIIIFADNTLLAQEEP